MTTAKIQPLCKKHNINLSCYDGFSVCPRYITERNMPLFMYKNDFCLIWKSQGVDLIKAIEELKSNLKIVENVISDEHVNSFNKYECKPSKVLSVN